MKASSKTKRFTRIVCIVLAVLIAASLIIPALNGAMW